MNKESTSKKKKKVAAVKIWTVKETTYDDGSRFMERTNDGFSPLELIGLSEFISNDVKRQIEGRITPDFIKRNVIKD